MNTKLLISLLGLMTLLTPIQAQIDQSCGTDEDTISESESLSQNCNTSFTNFRNNHIDDMVPLGIDRTLKIKTNVIFVQDDNGEGNFSLSNPDDVQFWDSVFIKINNRLKDLGDENCQCATPTHYENIHLEFDPRFVEIKDSYYWNHRHDADSNTLNSSNKPYLLAIHNLATQTDGYVDGYEWIITTDKKFWDLWVADKGNNPIWTYGYDCINGPVYTDPATAACLAYSGDPRYLPLSWPQCGMNLTYILHI